MNHAENDTEINATTSSNLCDSISFPPSVTKVNFIIASASSLAAKLESLVDNFRENESQIVIVSETWFKNCPDLNEAIEGLSEGEKIGSIIKNRPGWKRGGGWESSGT